MDTRARKEAIRAFKECKPERGAFAIRCAASGEIWVGCSPNLSAANNAAWFTLRTGSHRDKRLQRAWDAHGEDAFRFELLEHLEDEVNPLSLRDELAMLKQKWAANLAAQTLL